MAENVLAEPVWSDARTSPEKWDTIVTAVVQHTPGEREKFVRKIESQIRGEVVVVRCEGSPWETFCRSLLVADVGHWHLEDDVILAPDFERRAKELEKIGCIVRSFSQKYEASGFRCGSNYLCNLCVWIPRGYGGAIVEFARTWKRRKEHPTGLDLCIRDFLVSRREKYWLAIPSLVQHVRGPSLLGARSRSRRSESFDVIYGDVG